MKKLIIASIAALFATQAVANDSASEPGFGDNPDRKTWVLVMETTRGLIEFREHMHEPVCRNALDEIEAKLNSAGVLCLNFATGDIIISE